MKRFNLKFHCMKTRFEDEVLNLSFYFKLHGLAEFIYITYS